MERDEIERTIAAVALGDRAAFSRLYDATSGKLYAVCLRVLKHHATAEDAMQDAFVRIWTHAGRYRTTTGHSPMTWLITIARNAAIDRLRRSGRDGDAGTTELDLLPAAGLTPEDAAVAASEARRLGDCMAALPADRRSAIGAAYLDGASYKDLAERFDVPLNTIRTWLRRGLASLRECMAQ